MADQDNQNPTTGSQSDISKSQSQQQPSQASKDEKFGEQSGQSGQFQDGQQRNEELSGDQAATGQSQSPSGSEQGFESDTLTQQRSDIEGASLKSPESGEAESGFVGSEGQQDSSSELVEDEEFKKDGQGAPEGL